MKFTTVFFQVSCLLILSILNGCSTDRSVSEKDVSLAQTSPAELQKIIQKSEGSYLLISFFKAGTNQGKMELPQLVDLSKNEEIDLKVIVVAVETKNENQVLSNLAKAGVTVESYYFEGDAGEIIPRFEPDWPGILPYNLLFDKSGRIIEGMGMLADPGEVIMLINKQQQM